MLNNYKDTGNIKTYRFVIHHEITSPVLYQLTAGGNSNNAKTSVWKYFTGGFRYKLAPKNEIGIDYLFFEKRINTRNGEKVPGLFGSIVNPNFNYDAEYHIYQQKYLWLYYRRSLKNFFVSCGFGGGTYTYKNNRTTTTVFEKNTDWCNVIDAGYDIKIYKNIKLSAYLGILNSFSFKKEIYYEKAVVTDAATIYNYEVQQFKDLKKVEVQENKVIREYKYLGIIQSKFIPRLGLSLIIQI